MADLRNFAATSISSGGWLWSGLLGVMVVIVVGLVGATQLKAQTPVRESRGPFELETRVKRVSSGRFPNLSGNPFERREVTEFRLYHQGERLAIQTSGGQLDSFWDARFLDGAPRPAVLLATTGLWLVTEENGVLKIEGLKQQDTSSATIQWLDADDGQPARPVSVGIRDARGEPRGDRRGALLLLGRGVVLDLRTLAIQRFRPYQIDGYSVSNADALRLSPGRSQYVMLGEQPSPDGTVYAVVVADAGRKQAYALPFDRKSARLYDTREISAAWFDHHFAWTRDAGGRERLVRREGAPAIPRLGRIVQFGGYQVDYRLDEASPKLRDALLAFLAERFGAAIVPSVPGDSVNPDMRLSMRGWQYIVRHSQRDKVLILYFPSVRYAEEAEAYAHLKEAAQTFNAALAAGRHQDLFDGGGQ